MLLCDTGVLLAAGNVKDHAHQACLKLLRQAEGPLLVPSPVLGEIGYLLQSRVGPPAEVAFLRSFGGDGFHIAEVEDQDIQRMAGLVETYIDLPLGIVDAAVIAIAERPQLTEIATLDQRHFNIVRPSHVQEFTSSQKQRLAHPVECGCQQGPSRYAQLRMLRMTRPGGAQLGLS